MLYNICLSKTHCYECDFECNVYNMVIPITNRRRCLFGITPDEYNACLSKQDNDKIRAKLNNLMNNYLFKKSCNLPACNLCYYYRHPIGSDGPSCGDITGSVKELRNIFRFVTYENKPFD